MVMRKNIILSINIVLLIGCSSDGTMNEKDILIQKLDALEFLNKYHHQLHIMIGEEEGDGYKAFDEFAEAIYNSENPELIPVLSAFNRIKTFSIASDPVMKLDHLIDYYQSGLSLQVESVLRGYGYLRTFPLDSVLLIYDRLSQ